MSAYRPYPKYKPSGVEWLGDVPEGWVLRPLKFFATFRGGATPSKDNIEFWNGDIPWVSPKDMKRARISDSIDHITEDAILQSSTSRIGPNSLLMVVRSGILQHTIPVAINDVAVTLNQDMRAVAPGRQCRTDFLYYWFVGNNAPLLLELGKQGATVESIEQEYLANTRILLPPLPEQHQIATFLDRECGKLDTLQAKQERLIELLKEKRVALISHAVTRGLDPTAQLKCSGVEWIGRVPEHWEIQPLSYVCRFQSGKAHEPFIDDDGEFVCVNSRFVSTEGESRKFCSKNLSPAKSGDVLMVMSDLPNGRALAKAYFVSENEKLAVNQRVCILTAQSSDPKFLYYYLDRNQGFLRHDDGVSQTHLSNSDFTKLKLPVPPVQEQLAIVAHLDEKCEKIDQLKAKAERGIELLKERRSALISAAVTGKIDVREPAN